MKQEHLKEIILSTIHNYSMALRASEPGENERDAYHRLVDASALTGQTIFEKRFDGRYLVGNLEIEGERHRIFTLFRNTETGKLDVDLSLDHLGQHEEGLDQEIFMVIFKMLTIAVSIVIPSSITGVPAEDSVMVQAIKNRAG